jgi:hypothetical protein
MRIVGISFPLYWIYVVLEVLGEEGLSIKVAVALCIYLHSATVTFISEGLLL